MWHFNESQLICKVPKGAQLIKRWILFQNTAWSLAKGQIIFQALDLAKSTTVGLLADGTQPAN